MEKFRVLQGIDRMQTNTVWFWRDGVVGDHCRWGTEGIVPILHAYYNILVQYVKNYFKCLEY